MMMIPFVTLPRMNDAPVHVRLDAIVAFEASDYAGVPHTLIELANGSRIHVALPVEAFFDRMCSVQAVFTTLETQASKGFEADDIDALLREFGQ